MKHSCLVPNCQNNAPYFIGIRLRRPKKGTRPSGTAIWAPNTEAYLCDQHARQGYTIDITFTPLPTRNIETKTSVSGGVVVSRTTTINKYP
jgi:hypothetical protein